MNEEKWEQVKEIFHQAQALPVEERVEFLDRVCAGDLILREKVDDLLGSYESGFLEDTILHEVIEIVGSQNSFQKGQVIGRYRIGELIGTGGMGQVFLADDTELNRPVAFKVLHDDVAEDTERVRRFIQEARAASALNHPNILTIHEVGSFEGSRFIVSEYVDGETLRERMRSGITATESLEITCQIAAALQAAHSAGIVHRDIKPENIMLRQDGLVKVLDFGLAKLTEADNREEVRNAERGMRNEEVDLIPHSPLRTPHLKDPHLTAPGLIMGTVAYMSPEQARGQAVDSRTDLWSLGVVFHEMLTGESPFKGESVTDLVTSIIKHDPDSLDLKSISQELKPICAKALAKDKTARYQTAQDLLQDLQGEKKRMEYTIQPTQYSSLSSGEELKTQMIRRRPTLSAEYIFEGVRRHKLATFAVALLATFIGIGFSVYKFNGASPAAPEPPMGSVIGPSTTEEDLKISRVPTSGRMDREMVISPDGRYVAYVSPGEKTSIHLLQLATSSEVEIVPAPSSGHLEHLSFSPDGNYLYYVYNNDGIDQIHRVPALGGQPAKIVDNTACGVGVSPDGKTLAFHREGSDKSRTLVIANSDGSNERIVAKSSGNPADQFWCGEDLTWSPDGKEIACRSDHEEKNDKFKKLFALNIADGSRRPLSDKRWSLVDSVVYMPDGNLLIAAREASAETLETLQLWLIAPNSDPRRITTKLNSYSTMSATRNGDVVAAKQHSSRNDLWILPNNDVGRARQVTSSGEISGGFEWMPDGKLIFASNLSGAINIWTMNADGLGRRQLTRDQGLYNVFPTLSPDGKTIVFQSTRTDNRSHIFRMDADGSNLKQLTAGEGDEARPRISLDGKWIFYGQRNEKQSPNFRILRIPIEGGEPIEVTTLPEGSTLTSLDLSPVDGRIAYLAWRRVKVNRGPENTISIIASNGRPIKTLPLPWMGQQGSIRWTPDGRAIAFNDNRDKSGDIWTIPVAGKPTPKRLTNFKTPVTRHFDWTQDGKQLVLSRGTTTTDAVLISSIR